MSIYKKIILIAGIILSIAIGINTIVSTNFFNKEYSKVLESRAIVIGQTLKFQLDRLFSLGIPLNELTGFEEQCKEVLNKYKDVKSAMVVDLEGRILFHNDPTKQNKTITEQNTLNYIRGNKDTPVAIRDYRENDYNITVPIPNLNNQRVGAIIIEFPLEPIVQKTRVLVSYSFFVTLISFIIAIGLLFWGVNLWVNRPLTKLLLVIQEMGKKGVDFKGRVEIDSKDELGRLAHSFNQMTEDLQKITVSRDELAKEISEREKTEAALRESQERYRALMENSIFGIAVLDTNYKIIMVNSTFARLFKKPASDFVGKYCFKEFEKREAICTHCPGMRAMVSGKTEEVETQGVRDDGSRFSVRNRAVPFFGPDGTMKGFIEMVEDIDARKKAEEQQKIALKDLEDANRIMVGRELKMVELKKEINRLSQELGRPLPYDEASLG